MELSTSLEHWPNESYRFRVYDVQIRELNTILQLKKQVRKLEKENKEIISRLEKLEK
jgi:hypothetical protein